MDSKDDDTKRFVDSSLNAQKNPEFINFLSQDQENKIAGAKLEKMDYIAIFIALLETVFIPIFVLLIIFIILGLLFSGFFSGVSNNLFSYLDMQFSPIPPLIVNIVVVVLIFLLAYIFLRKYLHGPAQNPSDDLHPKY